MTEPRADDERLERGTTLPLWGGLIVLMALIAYVPALNAGYVWDDDRYVTENPTLRSLAGLGRIWFDLRALPQYYPLVHTTFWVESRLWGAHPFGFHLVNVLLHAGSAVLLWRLLRRLAVPGAWLAGALFALHPVHVESVAWIAERKNVLSGIFLIGALHPFVRSLGLDGEADGRAGNRRTVAAGLALFAAAMLSKTVSAALPVILVLMIWWKRGRVTRADLVVLAPLVAIGAALGLTTVWLEKHHVGAEGSEWSLTLFERFLVAGRALWFYAGKLLWPSPLTFIYPRWDLDAAAAWGIVFPLATVAVVAGLWAARRRLGRGPITAVLCFAAALGPALGFFDVYPMRYSFVADHFQYHASAALIGLGAAAGTLALGRRPWAGCVAAAALLAILGLLTFRQARIYRDEERLWRETLAKNPLAWMAHNNLGKLLARRGATDEAMEHYLETLRLKPDHVNARSNLAVALASRGRLGEAENALRDALRLAPEVAELRYNLGTVLAQAGRLDEAAGQYAEALRLAPSYDRARLMLAKVLANLGRLDEAASAYREHLGRHPRDGAARIALASILIGQGRLAQARSELEEELRIHPDDETAREMLKAW